MFREGPGQRGRSGRHGPVGPQKVFDTRCQTSVAFLLGAPRNPLVGNGIPFLSCREDPPKKDNTKVTLGLARLTLFLLTPCIACKRSQVARVGYRGSLIVRAASGTENPQRAAPNFIDSTVRSYPPFFTPF